MGHAASPFAVIESTIGGTVDSSWSVASGTVKAKSSVSDCRVGSVAGAVRVGGAEMIVRASLSTCRSTKSTVRPAAGVALAWKLYERPWPRFWLLVGEVIEMLGGLSLVGDVTGTNPLSV